MPKTPTEIGTYGDISYTAITKGGETVGYRARTRFRDEDGELRLVERTGQSKSKAKSQLVVALKQRVAEGGAPTDGSVTRNTTMNKLADLYLEECKLDEGISPQQLHHIQREINVSKLKDRRVKATPTKIKTTMGGLRMFEVTTARIELHLRPILAAGNKAKAEKHKQILKAMLDIAVRHGALKQNPVQALKPIRYKAGRPKALGREETHRLRAQLRLYATGAAIPEAGIPQFVKGPRRSPLLAVATDLWMATGARCCEVLALRRCDVDRSLTPWRVTIDATIAYVPGIGTQGGYFRQEHTKTGEDGKRVIVLPPFAIRTLQEAMGADAWVDHDETLLFPCRTGGVWSTANFFRAWRAACGTTFAWVTPKSFRKTVATVLENEHDETTAGKQLGHLQPGGKRKSVTRKHYIEHDPLVPDSSATLEEFYAGTGAI